MCNLDHKEGWARKNWCFWTEVWEKTLESPLEWQEIKPVNPKGNLPWIFIGRTNSEAEAPIFGHLIAKCWLIRNNPDVGKNEGRRRRRQQKIRWLDGITDMSLSKLWKMAKHREAWHAAVHGVSKSQTQLSEWTTTTKVVWNTYWRILSQNIREHALVWFLQCVKTPNIKDSAASFLRKPSLIITGCSCCAYYIELSASKNSNLIQ